MLQLFRGDVVTMDAHRPFGTGILAEDGVIREVGEFEALKDSAPGAAVEDYGDAAILPGFIDGHSHLSAVAYESILFDARPESGCRSVEELVRLGQKYLREHALSEGQWMLGMGYDNGVFPGEAHPTRFDLDRISEEIPIAVTHVSGHLCAVNSRAMEILGYDGPDPQVPEGGEVDPSGLLKEEAFSDLKVRQAMKGPDVNQLMEGTRQAARLYASYGITTMQDARTGEEEYRLLLLAGKSGALSGDVVCYLTPEAAEKWLPRQNPALNAYKDHCRMAGAKIFLDGSPQGKTAWLSRPYARVPEGKPAGYRGFPVRRPEDVTWFFGHCMENHWQVNVHANGDAAIDQMLDCYEAAREAAGCREDLRPVIIHCQTVRPDQLKRMAEMGVRASFFHDHVWYWGDYHYESVLGPERAEQISPLSLARKEGVPFSLHQDSPVVPPDIMRSVHNAVNRRTQSGRILGPEQRICVMDALKAHTVWAAEQIFEEERKGTIAPGKLADFAVLEKNPLNAEPESLRDIRVLRTVKEGKVIYQTGRNADDR